MEMEMAMAVVLVVMHCLNADFVSVRGLCIVRTPTRILCYLHVSLSAFMFCMCVCIY